MIEHDILPQMQGCSNMGKSVSALTIWTTLTKKNRRNKKSLKKKSISQIAIIICDQKQTVLNKRVHIYKISTANVMLNGGMFIPVRKSFRNSMLWITSPTLISVWIVSFPIFKSLLNLY